MWSKVKPKPVWWDWAIKEKGHPPLHPRKANPVLFRLSTVSATASFSTPVLLAIYATRMGCFALTRLKRTKYKNSCYHPDPSARKDGHSSLQRHSWMPINHIATQRQFHKANIYKSTFVFYELLPHICLPTSYHLRNAKSLLSCAHFYTNVYADSCT